MTEPKYIQICTTTNREIARALSACFTELEALAVTMTDAKDEPLFQLTPTDDPLWSHTVVRALFDFDAPVNNIIKTITTLNTDFKALEFHTETVADKNWVAVMQHQFHTQQFGDRLWICPQWEKETWKKTHDKTNTIFIEPGLAFGTGTHPTTKLCLTWLANHPPLKKSVIDYGCGSGILALGALVLGASEVWATDHDPLALQSTENNASYNHFNMATKDRKNTSSRGLTAGSRHMLLDPAVKPRDDEENKLHIMKTNQMHDVHADLVLANILANPLIELAPTLTALTKTNGTLVISGLLANDIDRVVAAYKNHFKKTNVQLLDEWALVEMIKHAI